MRLSGRAARFQSTRPRGARPLIITRFPVKIKFQSTRPRGARRVGGETRTGRNYFNPRAHEGRDSGQGHDTRLHSISIHAPTRGATGAGRVQTCSRLDFNPRAHEGRDAICAYLGVQPGISIHAPTRGATSSSRKSKVQQKISIHAPTRGATADDVAIVGMVRFQSTRPRGARHQTADSATPPTLFQSTRPRGARRAGVEDDWGFGIFQSTRPRGARLLAWTERARLAVISIHAPTRGATGNRPGYSPRGRHFNPRAHEGRDARLVMRMAQIKDFNPRAHEGRDSRTALISGNPLVQTLHIPRRFRTQTARIGAQQAV